MDQNRKTKRSDPVHSLAAELLNDHEARLLQGQGLAKLGLLVPEDRLVGPNSVVGAIRGSPRHCVQIQQKLQAVLMTLRKEILQELARDSDQGDVLLRCPVAARGKRASLFGLVPPHCSRPHPPSCTEWSPGWLTFKGEPFTPKKIALGSCVSE